jgi:hypothetical protein
MGLINLIKKVVIPEKVFCTDCGIRLTFPTMLQTVNQTSDTQVGVEFKEGWKCNSCAKKRANMP